MDLIVKRASALTPEERAAMGITGIPLDWPVETNHYEGTIPSGFELMSEVDLASLKANNQSAYDAWIATLRPIIIEPPENPVSSAGNPLVETAIYTGKAGSKSVSLVTPDFSDRTTWYQKSVQVVSETLTDSGNGLTFTSAHPHWINIYHGKLTYTHKQIPKRDGTYGKHANWAASITVNGSAASNFTIDYALGTVTFGSSQTGNTVVATYWHNDGIAHPSEWLLTPPAGKKYLVEHMEMQASVGVVLADTLRFEIWAGSSLATYGTFPDYLFEAGYGQMRADYRNANDFINAANLGQGTVAKFGSLTKEVIVLPFNYIQAFYLDSAFGATFRMVLLNDIPYADADIATGTFYTQIS